MRKLISYSLLLAGCASASPSLRSELQNDLAGNANAAVARREIEAFEGRGDLAVADEVFAPGYQLHFGGNPTMDIEGHKQVLAGFRAAFPDLSIRVLHQVVDGDRVANHIELRGTQKGAFNGVPATGKTVTITGTNLMRFENGKIAELWGQLDAVGLMTQLGAMPPPPGAAPSTRELRDDASVTPDAAKEVVRRFVEAFNQKDPERLSREFSDDYVLDFPGGPRGKGIEGIKQATTGFIAAFPDLTFTVEDLVSSGGWVVWRWNMTGTHRGNLGPFQASGKPVHLSGISLICVRGGKIVEDRVRADMVGLLMQIGAIPAPPQG